MTLFLKKLKLNQKFLLFSVTMDKLIIPAMRGTIGNTTYYLINLSFKQVAERVTSMANNEIFTAQSLKDQLQRSLTNNVQKIKDYILNHDDHFFGSLVLATYNGNPLWKSVRMDIDEESYNDIGLLILSGEETIFPVDGQHRVEGIKLLLTESPQYSSETIPVMVIGHTDSIDGKTRTRRIFSTLNRYAKPVGKGDIIALDEDDIVAIITRDLLEEYPLFQNKKILVSQTKAIPKTDKASFTTLMTLYDCNVEIFKAYLFSLDGFLRSSEKMKEFLRIRPSDGQIKDFKQYLLSFWDKMQEYYPILKEFAENDSDTAAVPFRTQDDGGNALFRPAFLSPFIQAITTVKVKCNLDYSLIMGKYAGLNFQVSSDIWKGLLWNYESQTMINGYSGIIRLLLLYLFDHSLVSEQEREKVQEKYASSRGVSSAAIEREFKDLSL